MCISADPSSELVLLSCAKTSSFTFIGGTLTPNPHFRELLSAYPKCLTSKVRWLKNLVHFPLPIVSLILSKFLWFLSILISLRFALCRFLSATVCKWDSLPDYPILSISSVPKLPERNENCERGIQEKSTCSSLRYRVERSFGCEFKNYLMINRVL